MYNIESIWRAMLTRTTYANSNMHKAYMDCEICEEWKEDRRAFTEWFINHLYNCNGEMLQLDKDLFSNGRKIYSPQTCCLLPQKINVALAYRKSKNSNMPCGVVRTPSGKYAAYIQKDIGHLSKTFLTIEEADKFYRDNKKRHIREMAENYKKYLPEYIYNALVDYRIN